MVCGCGRRARVVGRSDCRKVGTSSGLRAAGSDIDEKLVVEVAEEWRSERSVRTGDR